MVEQVVPENVVVAIDGRRPSESALRWAMERAGRTKAKVTLVTVVEDTLATLVPGLAERLTAAAQAILDAAKERATKLAPDIEIAGEVAHGSVVSALSAISRDADLLVIGTHKHGVIVGEILGTLSLRLAETVPCSIAVIPDAPPGGRNVVVGVDGSEEALIACEIAAEEAAARGSVLLIVCAGYVTNPLLTTLVPADIASLNHGDALAQARTRVLTRFPTAEIRTQSIYGSPADALREASHSSGLLVLGHRTRSHLQRLMGSSVHSQVLLEMSVPVLLVRGSAGATVIPAAAQSSQRQSKPYTGARTIVGWSGSAASESALNWATRHYELRGGRLVLVRVVDAAALSLHPTDSDRVVAAASMELEDRVEQIRNDNPGLVVEALLLAGAPYDELRRLSDAFTLVVVGSEQSRLPNRNAWSMGVRLAAHASGPIAIIPQGERESSEVVVVGVDGSAASAAAALWAAEDAALRGSELRIVHAWQEPMAWYDLYSPTSEDSLRSVAKAHEHVLEEAVSEIGTAYPELRLQGDLIEGVPATVLLMAAKGARLLVVGTHGLNATMRFLLGSVSHTAALNIESPMIIVPAMSNEKA